MTIGILRPVIVIPAEILRQLTISEQTMVLAHELAHIRRGDLFWSFVAALVRAVFFFHPLVWLSQRQLTLAQEIAADELAIARQQHDPVGYGKLLVSVVGKLGPGRMVPTMSMGTTGPMESLTRRLVAMTLIGCGSRRVVVGSAVLLGAVLLLGLVPWRLVAAEPKAVEKAPSSPAKESTKVTAGAAAYAGNNAESKERNQHQLLVKLKVSENRPGKPEEILCRPHVVTRVGQNSYVMVSGNELQMIVEIQSSLRSDKIEAVITAKLTHDPEGNNPAVFAPPPVVLAVPSPTMANAPKSQTAILEAVEPDSSIFRLEATITTTVEPKQQGGSGPSAVVSGAGLWPWVFQPDPARGYGPSAAASGAVYRSPAEAPLWKGYYVKDLLKPGKDGATNIHGLIERIKSQVTPSAWADHSGPAEITPYSEDALVVKHTPKGHEEVVQMLQQLRRRDDIKQAQAPVERHAR